ncbi:ankyrin repeat domain-containing protein [Bremerella cremea]|uniref:Uncharacterized protein n=1 Tax=Blastopirellula marina TaxID=124 RepID=A0A2S8FZ96_9BACT|nr:MULTISPECIES: ankyrin repeat domain-containing protein [Pirellulaceae]PQO37515.1 hypothetical protein C5Y83_06110 [Blastopirellula marina]RCS49902.1 ankyrin repeat domain-containing protein [Bremerella cremea]
MISLKRIPIPRFSILTLLGIIAVIAVGLTVWERWVSWPDAQADFAEIVETDKPKQDVLKEARGLVRRYPQLARQPGAMTWAVIQGDVETCRVFLDAGAKLVDDQDDEDPSFPLLYLPVSQGEVEKVELLISRGAKVDQPFDLDFFSLRGISYLETAASFGHTEMCRVLLDNGAQVDYKSSDGNTALHAAVGCFSPKTVQLLVDHHAQCTANAKGETPLSMAQDLQNHFQDQGVTNDSIEKITAILEAYQQENASSDQGADKDAT